MPITFPFSASRLLPPGRRIVLICVGLSALALAASGVLAGLPIAGNMQSPGPGLTGHVGFWPVLQQLLPLLAAALGLLAGVMSLLSAPEAISGAPADASNIPGLQGVVRQLTGLLEEEHRQIAAFQEIYGNSTREALVVSRRLALLADVALDAETRLVAGVSQAEEALRQPGGSADGSPRALPEITDIVRRSILDQSRAIASSLDAMSARLVAEADGPIQTFRTTVAGVSDQIKTLGDTAAALSRDVIAFETAGRGIATASTTVVSRVNDAVIHIDAALMQLPDAAGTVVAAAEQAAHNLAEASAALRAEATDNAASSHQILQAVMTAQEHVNTLQVLQKGMTDRAAAVHEEVTALQEARQGIMNAAATIHEEASALQETGHGFVEAVATVRAETVALQEARHGITEAVATVREETVALQETRQDMAEASGTILLHTDNGMARIDAALGQLPVVAEAIATAAERAEHALADATRVLGADGASLMAAGQETIKAADALRQETDLLKAVGHDLSDAGHHAIAAVSQTVETAMAHLGALIVDADAARQGTSGLAELAGTLQNAAAVLVDGAYNLDAAGNRVAIAGEKATEHFAAHSIRHHDMLQTLPDVTAEITAAMEALRVETSVLMAAAQQVSSSGQTTTAAVTEVAARVETSAASLDTTGRMISAAGQEVAAQLGNLAEIAGYAETQASQLPAVAAEIAAASARLQAVTEAWRPEALLTILPEAAARLDAAAPRLDQIDELSMRLQSVVAGLEAGQQQEAAVATMAVLSSDINAAVRRVEAALANHDEAWPAVVKSIEQIQAATMAVAQAVAAEPPSSASASKLDGLPVSLATALRHFDGVATESEMLLQETEALAEAVLSGHAPNLSPLLVDRAPGLLAGIEATTQRLRSVATALALASDGKPALERRLS